MTDTSRKCIDLKYSNPYPSNMLSNLYPHKFILNYDNKTLECGSLEGFLQSLKHSDVKRQQEVALMHGYQAKQAGNVKWYNNQMLYFGNTMFSRHSEYYIDLLFTAYCTVYYTCIEFKNALHSTKGCHLTHKIGCDDPFRTILTNKEYLDVLEILREQNDT